MLDWMEALKLALVPSVLVSNFIGTAVGIIIGALPGLTSTMGVALAVPLTYGMAPASGFAMLCGIYCHIVSQDGICEVRKVLVVRLCGSPGQDDYIIVEGACNAIGGYTQVNLSVHTSATTSISTNAPFGKVFTATAERAG